MKAFKKHYIAHAVFMAKGGGDESSLREVTEVWGNYLILIVLCQSICCRICADAHRPAVSPT